jgi:polar amino acid transport system substrate-binding protein
MITSDIAPPMATRKRAAHRVSAAFAAALATAFTTAVAMPSTPAQAQRAENTLPGRATAVPQAAEPDTVRRVALRFLTDSDYPPFNYIDPEGQLTGFNVEVARAICLELAAACDIQTRPWADLLPALKRGEADAVIASHAVSPRLLAEFDVSERYYQVPARFVGKAGRAFPDVSPAGLDGFKIAVTKGTAHEAYLRALFTLSAIQVYDNAELARDAVIGGTADLLFDDGIGLSFWLLGTASKACCDFKGGPFFEPRYFGDGVGITINRNDPALKAQLNAALKRLRDTGRQEELVSRSFPLRGN